MEITKIEQLKVVEQKWLATAIVSIVLADEKLEIEELDFIKKVCKVFLKEEPKQTLETIKSYLQNKEIPELDPFSVDDVEHLIFMLDMLSAAVFSNGKKLHQEVEKFFNAGKKLGVSYDILAYRLSLEADKNRIQRKLESVKKDIKVRLGDKNIQ